MIRNLKQAKVISNLGALQTNDIQIEDKKVAYMAYVHLSELYDIINYLFEVSETVVNPTIYYCEDKYKKNMYDVYVTSHSSRFKNLLYNHIYDTMDGFDDCFPSRYSYSRNADNIDLEMYELIQHIYVIGGTPCVDIQQNN